MSVALERIPIFFAEWVTANGSAGPRGEAAAWLAAGELDPAGFKAIVTRHGVSRERWFRCSVLDLVLDYSRHRLSQSLHTLDDVADIQVLKHALHVAEGEFFEHRPAEVSAFIQLVLDGILSDDRIDHYEELCLVGVQAAFDLSYDQFLSLGRPALERAVANIEFKRALAEQRGDARAVDVLTQSRAALEPLYWLTSRQRRTLGALY